MVKPRKPQINPDLDYIDKLKAIGMSDRSIPDVTFTFADYQCLERLMNIRDITVEDDLKKYLRNLYEQDNETMCKNIAEIVSSQNKLLFDTLKSQSEAIKGIAEDSTETRKDIKLINERLTIIEKRTELNETTVKGLDERLTADKKKIEELEKKVEALEPDAVIGYMREMSEFRNIIKKLTRTQSWWNMAFRIAISVFISLLLVYILM